MNSNLPKTLLEAIKYFSDVDTCIQVFASLRWENGIPVCPRCESEETSFLKTRKIWKCKGCKKQFSVKVGTIFEDSPIGLDKWLMAIWMIANCKNGVSSYEIHREIGVTQKTAWFMLHRIRRGMETGSFQKLSGNVEVDETFVGGKAKNMHKDKRERVIQGRGSVGKTAVMGHHALEVKPLAKSTSYIIRSKAFCRFYGIVPTQTLVFSDIVSDEVGLILDLTKVTVLAPRVRQKKTVEPAKPIEEPKLAPFTSSAFGWQKK